jgi:hypothetical protein
MSNSLPPIELSGKAVMRRILALFVAMDALLTGSPDLLVARGGLQRSVAGPIEILI